jgi:hypothetical protein
LGDGGLVSGPKPQPQIPNPKSPIPNPHENNKSIFKKIIKIKINKKLIKIIIEEIKKNN